MQALLIAGCFFPVLGWLTFIASMLYSWITGKHTSAVLIPIIGPVLINIWSVNMGHPWWAFLLPWVIDISTVSLVGVLPAVFKNEWNYSKYNNQLSLCAKKENQTVVLLLQKNNTYILRFNWELKKDECGVSATNEIGTFETTSVGYQLKSHTSKVRGIKAIDRGYLCNDSESEGIYNLNGYVFR